MARMRLPRCAVDNQEAPGLTHSLAADERTTEMGKTLSGPVLVPLPFIRLLMIACDCVRAYGPKYVPSNSPCIL